MTETIKIVTRYFNVVEYVSERRHWMMQFHLTLSHQMQQENQLKYRDMSGAFVA